MGRRVGPGKKADEHDSEPFVQPDGGLVGERNPTDDGEESATARILDVRGVERRPHRNGSVGPGSYTPTGVWGEFSPATKGRS